MGNPAVVKRADSFGRALNVIGFVVVAGGLMLGATLAWGARHSAATYGQPSVQGLGVLAAVGIGFGCAVIGAGLAWAGYVLRALAAIYVSGLAAPIPAWRTAPQAQPPAAPQPLPALGTVFTA